MKTSYFTFGQSHLHRIDDFIYDKDIIVKITSEDPRATMCELFGREWGHEYDEAHAPNTKNFPRGIKEVQ